MRTSTILAVYLGVTPPTTAQLAPMSAPPLICPSFDTKNFVKVGCTYKLSCAIVCMTEKNRFLFSNRGNAAITTTAPWTVHMDVANRGKCSYYSHRPPNRCDIPARHLVLNLERSFRAWLASHWPLLGSTLLPPAATTGI